MKYLLITLMIVLQACGTRFNGRQPFTHGKWIDLTHSFSTESIYWPTAEKFKMDTAFEGITNGGYFYSAYVFCAAEHGGTHLDAPFHFAEGKWKADEIPLQQLTGYAVVVDVSVNAAANPDYQVTLADVENWERINGRIPDYAMVLFRTGYGQFYHDAGRYLGTTARGADAIALLHFPGISPQLAEWMVKNRRIKAVGIDTPSIDYGQSKDFKTHRILYEQNIPGFENLANLQSLPPTGTYIVALPMKIKGGSGAPLRIIGWVNK